MVATVQHSGGNRAAGALVRHLRHGEGSAAAVSRRRDTATPMMYRVDVDGATATMTEAQYRRGIAAHASNITRTFLPRSQRRLNRAIEAYNDRVQAYNDQSFVGWLLDDSDKWSKAGRTIERARSAVRLTQVFATTTAAQPSPHLLRLTLDALLEAEAQNEAAENALQAYTKSIIGRGEFVVDGLEVAKDAGIIAMTLFLASFAVPAVTVAGAAQGLLITGGTVVVFTSAEHLGREATGEELDYAKEYRAMTKEALFSMATGMAGDVVASRVLGPVIKDLARDAMSDFTSATAEAVEHAIAESLTGSAKSVFETAVTQVLKSYDDPKSVNPDKFTSDLRKALVKGGLFTHVKLPPGG